MRKRKGTAHKVLHKGMICEKIKRRLVAISAATFSLIRVVETNKSKNVHGDLMPSGTGLALWRCKQTGDLVYGKFKTA